jgi:hypothetical protein
MLGVVDGVDAKASTETCGRLRVPHCAMARSVDGMLTSYNVKLDTLGSAAEVYRDTLELHNLRILIRDASLMRSQSKSGHCMRKFANLVISGS